MNSRSAAAAIVVALAVCFTTGCTPQAEPEPTATTGFATDAEAFAAAEKTYRLYVDALNQVDLSDPETFEEVYRWTTGDASAGERKSLSQMHADGWSVTGSTTVQSVASGAESLTDSSVELQVCTNVGDITVEDASGHSVVSADRPAIQPLRVDLVPDAGSPTGLLIRSIEGGSHLCE